MPDILKPLHTMATCRAQQSGLKHAAKFYSKRSALTAPRDSESMPRAKVFKQWRAVGADGPGPSAVESRLVGLLAKIAADETEGKPKTLARYDVFLAIEYLSRCAGT
jgi:hypothetical protein